MVNHQRLMTLPHALKPVLVIILLIAIISGACVKNSTPGGWFFWLTTIIEFVFIIVVTGLFLMEIERLMTCGRDNWAVAELIYSGIFFVFTVINIFVTASWFSETVEKSETSGPTTTMVSITERSGAALFTTVSFSILSSYGICIF